MSKRKKKQNVKGKEEHLKTGVVLKIKRIREETGWCGEKIVWESKTKHGIKVSQASVYRVLRKDILP